MEFVEYDTPETRAENGVDAMPGGGEVAWFKDPEGNLVGVVPARGKSAASANYRGESLAENSENVIDWRLVDRPGSYPVRAATRIAGRRGSGWGGTGCFAVPGPQGAGQPFQVRHGHGERRVATSAKR